VKKDQVHIFPPKPVSSLPRFGWSIHQSEVYHLHAGPGQLPAGRLKVTFQPVFETFELRPIRVKANPKKTDTQRRVGDAVSVASGQAILIGESQQFGIY
jgi:hypothetical protein